MKVRLLYLLRALGVFQLARYLTRHKVRVLAYHGIWLGSGHFGNYLYMSAETFASRMRLLQRSPYRALPLSALVDGTELPDSSLVITIDDGWYGTYKHMLPALEAAGLPATIYVTSYYSDARRPVYEVMLRYLVTKAEPGTYRASDLPGYGLDGQWNLTADTGRDALLAQLQKVCDTFEQDEDGQRFSRAVAGWLGVDYEPLIHDRVFDIMNRDEVADMAARGFDIQLHTHRHRVKADGQYCVADEVRDNRASLEALVDQPLVHFCYPSGEFDPHMPAVLQDTGVVSATTTRQGLFQPGTDAFTIPRLFDGEAVTEIEFEAELAGLGELVRAARSRFRRSA